MRILGVKADHPVAIKARACLHKLGGTTGAPSWGKFWLSILNVYDWEGNHNIPCELWCVPGLSTLPRARLNRDVPTSRLLPDWVFFHPHRWWIHTRNVYIPMGYLYGVRFKMEETDLVLALREVSLIAPHSVSVLVAILCPTARRHASRLPRRS